MSMIQVCNWPDYMITDENSVSGNRGMAHFLSLKIINALIKGTQFFNFYYLFEQIFSCS